MSEVFRNVTAVLIALAIIFVLGILLTMDRPKAQTVGATDLVAGKAYEYEDFHSCTLTDGTRAYDVHMGGQHRSLRAQLVSRVNNLGNRTLRVVTNDPTLPKGTVRFVRESVVRRDLEGHNAGTDWSSEVLQINPRRPIQVARNIPSCGPARR